LWAGWLLAGGQEGGQQLSQRAAALPPSLDCWLCLPASLALPQGSHWLAMLLLLLLCKQRGERSWPASRSWEQGGGQQPAQPPATGPPPSLPEEAVVVGLAGWVDGWGSLCSLELCRESVLGEAQLAGARAA